MLIWDKRFARKCEVPPPTTGAYPRPPHRQKQTPGVNRRRLLMWLSCRCAVSDVLQNPLDGCGGKLGEQIGEAVRIQSEPLPVDIAPLIQSQRVPIQAGVAPGVTVAGEEKPLQNVIDLLRCCRDGMAELLPRSLGGQDDVDGQTHLERDDDGRVGGVVQVGGQLTGVGQGDLGLAGAGVADAGGVQGEAAVVMTHSVIDVHCVASYNLVCAAGLWPCRWPWFLCYGLSQSLPHPCKPFVNRCAACPYGLAHLPLSEANGGKLYHCPAPVVLLGGEVLNRQPGYDLIFHAAIVYARPRFQRQGVVFVAVVPP